MKKFILASMIAAAAMFTACGDDDNNSSTSSSNGSVESCDIKSKTVLGNVHACIESDDMKDAEKQCKEELASAVPGKPEVSFGSGCPKGFKSKCEYEKDGAHLTVLIYDETLSGLTCTELKTFIMQ